jgi:hypothetical protein
MAAQISIESPLPPSECARRLDQAVEPAPVRAGEPAPGGRIVVGKVKPPELRLRVDDPRFGNAFQPIFAGRIEPAPDGTTITGTFRMRRFAQVFMTAWFGLGVFMAAFTLLTIVSGRAAEAAGDEGATLAGLGAILIGGFLLTRLGRWLARAEPGTLVAFLRRTLDATDAAPPGRSS